MHGQRAVSPGKALDEGQIDREAVCITIVIDHSSGLLGANGSPTWA
jgi:hypothetical protein